MQTAELKEYLGIVVDMEKEVYQQEKTIKNFEEQIKNLAKEKTLFKPSQKMIEKPKISDFTLGDLLICSFLGLFHGGIAGAVICLFCDMFGFLPDYELQTILLVVCIVVGVLIDNAKHSLDINEKNWILESKYAKDKADAEYQYQQEMAVYKELLLEDQERLQNEKNEKIYLEQDVIRLQEQLEATKMNLSRIYSRNVIFPKYRNLIMVCSLYEYICAGRCTSLEGYEGAYNILETEIRLDHVITRLDRIIAQLEAIKTNQYIIYSAIQDANQQSAQILESTNQMAEAIRGFRGDTAQLNERIKELQQSSALTAYHTERSQKELAYMNRMDYLTGRNDGPFYNIPPT